MERISGASFSFNMNDLSIRVNKFTLDIDDGSGPQKNGVAPDGWVRGAASASGELEVDAVNLNLIIEAAGRAGSFRELEEFDLTSFARAGNTELRVQAFGCKLRIGKLLDIKPEGGEAHLTTIPFDVTSPDFVRINGVPYLSEADTEGFI